MPPTSPSSQIPAPRSPRIRCFIALDLSDEVRGQLAQLVDLWRREPADVRWTPAGNIHLTLKFLGEVGELAPIHDAVAAVCRERPPFSFVVRGVGGFPSLRRPRVLWAGVDSDATVELAADLGCALEPLGFAPDERTFRPHLTLGRVRSQRGWRRLAPRVRDAEDKVFGTCKALAAHAYRSDLRPDGAVYTRLWTAVMGGTNGG